MKVCDRTRTYTDTYLCVPSKSRLIGPETFPKCGWTSILGVQGKQGRSQLAHNSRVSTVTVTRSMYVRKSRLETPNLGERPRLRD